MIQHESNDRTPPLVSVLMPAYNHEAWIAESMESVITQDYRPIELVIVNDGSQDRTGEIAKEFKTRHTELVRYEEQSNSGLCATLNRLVDLARGEYVKVLASDDLLAPGVINDHVHLMANESRRSVMACFGPRRCIDDEGNLLVGLRARKQIKNLDYFSNLLLGRSPCMLQQMTIRREAIEMLRFDEKLVSEDIDFMLRFFQQFDAVESMKASVLYRIHQQGLSKQSEANTANTRYVLSKVEQDPRFASLGLRRILATIYFHHAVYFSATGRKGRAIRRLLKGMKLNPFAVRYVPSVFLQVLIPVWLRTKIRRLRNKMCTRTMSRVSTSEGR